MSVSEDKIQHFLHMQQLILALARKIQANLQEYLPQARRESEVSDIEKIMQSLAGLIYSLDTKLSRDTLISLTKDTILHAHLSELRHVLRNQVNAILGYISLIADETTPTESSISISLTEANILAQLIEQLGIPNSKRIIKQDNSQWFNKNILEKSNFDETYLHFKKHFSILIVDDVVENCLLLKKYLNDLGYRNMLTCYNGDDALAMINQQKIDLVLLDIDMPGMTGIELLKQLKEALQQRRLMVIIITGSDTIENALACIQLGAEDILAKPFNSDILRVRIGACLEKKWFLNKEIQYLEHLEIEKRRFEDLLNAIFPPSIVKKLAETGRVNAEEYPNVAILFTDIVGFTHYCSTHNLKDVMENIQAFADICESAAAKFNLQKIKTIGDGFLTIAGMLTQHKNPVFDCIRCAEEIIVANARLGASWQLRSGIDYGTVIGGIVGHRQYLFDIWSDTVNTAARIQALAEPGAIYLSEKAWLQVEGLCRGKPLGEYQMKGKKPMQIFQYLSKY